LPLQNTAQKYGATKRIRQVIPVSKIENNDPAKVSFVKALKPECKKWIWILRQQ
jgi:hypothetical protein